MLEDHIERSDLSVDAQLVKVFLHKGYWSRVRGKPITMDVSLELDRRGAGEPYLVWIWECKDYHHRVPVDDVEEFHRHRALCTRESKDRLRGTSSPTAM